jgi:hypothetical protein
MIRTWIRDNQHLPGSLTALENALTSPSRNADSQILSHYSVPTPERPAGMQHAAGRPYPLIGM